jgi:hypothetical protein
MLFNNPNRASRSGYQRLGWTLLPPFGVRWHAVPPGRREAPIEDAGALAAIAGERSSGGQATSPSAAAREQAAEASRESAGHGPVTRRWATARDERWLGWRYGGGSGRAYRAVRLAGSDRPSGLVYRVEHRRGVRVLVALELAGPAAERRRLALAAARREGALALLTADERPRGSDAPGTATKSRGLSLGRPGSVLAVRPLAALDPDPMLAASWALSLGDLEGVI